MIYLPQCIEYPIKAFHQLADNSLLMHVHQGDLGSGERAAQPAKQRIGEICPANGVNFETCKLHGKHGARSLTGIIAEAF